MKKNPYLTFRVFGLLFLLVAFGNSARATHFAGADLTYTCLGGLTYRIELTVYRDCAGSQVSPGYGIAFSSASCGFFFTDTIEQVPPTGQEITFPCASSVTKCTNPASLNPGIQKYVYAKDITLPGACSDWVFSWNPCCRNCDITTINIPPGCGGAVSNSAIYVEATLNNLQFPCNSSPVFSNIPITFLCVGQNFTYNHGVVDPDGDSLVYTLVDALANSTTPVPYLAPFNGSNPLSSTPPVAIDPITGDIFMAPTIQQVGIVAVLIQQYRDGVLAGSVTRDMEVYVRNCINDLPTASGINNTTVRDTTICANQTICFDIFSGDINAGDTVTMVWNNAIPGATFNVTGTPFPVGTFCWTPADSNISLNPQTFTVTVRDNACPNNGFQTYSYNIFVPTPYFDITVTNPLCNGDTSGIAIAAPIFGGNYDYVWNPGNINNDTLSNLPSGNYTVTVTDLDRGCVANRTVSVNNPDPIVVSFNVTNVPCTGDSTGTIIANVSGGTGSIRYLWSTSPNDTINTISNLAAGTYILTLTDSNGCSRTDSITISEPTAPLLVSIIGNDTVQCSNSADGQLIAIATGGTGFINYSWNSAPVQINDTAINLTGGNYTVTVTDSLGCVASANANIIAPPPFNFTINASLYPGGDNVSCFGLSDGSISATVNGGNGGNSYHWIPNNDTTLSIANLSAGTYTLTVTDSLGCTDNSSITLSEPALFTVNASSTSPLCVGQNSGSISALVGGGNAAFDYTWTPGNFNTPNVSGLGIGTYIVNVTDTNGCAASDTVTIIDPPIITAVLQSDSSDCAINNGSAIVTPSGGSGTYTYTWAPTGGSDSIATGLGAGIYTISIVDGNGCNFDTTVNVPSTSTLSASVSVNSPLCNGDTNGSAVINLAGSNGPPTYTWSPNVSSSNTALNLAAGNYACLIEDSSGCTFNVSININQPDSVNGLLQAATDVQCLGDSSGQASIIGIGGTPGYTYAWSPYGGNASTATNLDSGLYTVTIIDTNGCSGTLSIQINKLPNNLNSTINSISDPDCFGGSNGAAWINVSGAVGTLQYTWNTVPVQFNDTAINLSAGTYLVTVLDSNGCSITDSVTINNPLPLQVSATAPSFDCSGNVPVTISANIIQGGTSPYQYLWNTGPNDTLNTLGNILGGSYSVIVTDQNNCTATAAITISTNNNLPVNSTIVNNNCFGFSNGSISLTPTAGQGFYTYAWLPNISSSNAASSLTSGLYNIVVTDTASGCTNSLAINITQPDSFTITFNSTNAGCNGANTGSINVSVIGGSAPYHYQWSTGVNDTLSGLGNQPSNLYTVTITDSLGCIATASDSILSPDDVVANSVVDNITCNNGNDGSIQLQVTGGSGNYFFSWLPNVSTVDSAINVGPGNYIITITDQTAANCSTSVNVTLANPQPIAVAAGNDVDTCYVNGTYQLSGNTPLNGSSLWTLLGGGGVLTNPTSPNAILSSAVGFQTLLYTITEGLCSNSDSVLVRIDNQTDCETEFDMPTGFTPNGDGSNDGYYIRGLYLYPTNTFKVFNRWGNLVYQTQNYKNTDWVGQNDSNEPLPDATYFVLFQSGEFKKGVYVDMRK